MRAVSEIMTKDAGVPAAPEVAALFGQQLAAGGAAGVPLRQKNTDGRLAERQPANGEMRGRVPGSGAAEGSAVISALAGGLAPEFGGLAGKLPAETKADGPDLDSIKTALRNGAQGFKALFEEAARRLPVPAWRR